MSVQTYVGLYMDGKREMKCPMCGAGFNPGCGGHLGVYFEV